MTVLWLLALLTVSILLNISLLLILREFYRDMRYRLRKLDGDVRQIKKSWKREEGANEQES